MNELVNNLYKCINNGWFDRLIYSWMDAWMSIELDGWMVSWMSI